MVLKEKGFEQDTAGYSGLAPESQSVDVSVMKRKILITVVSTLVLLIAGGAILLHATFGDMIGQMRAGKRYMKSLSQDDRAEWTDRTVALLAAHPLTNDNDVVWLRGHDVPEELAQLQIQRVDVLKDQVCYVWVGGLDHTLLSVRRTVGGDFQFYAQYNDTHGEELWPNEKDANKVLDATSL